MPTPQRNGWGHPPPRRGRFPWLVILIGFPVIEWWTRAALWCLASLGLLPW